MGSIFIWRLTSWILICVLSVSVSLPVADNLMLGRTSEWSPCRNQHLVTIVAAHALVHGLGAAMLGVIAGRWRP